MNANINYIGILKYLTRLTEKGLISETEAKKLARAIATKTGADLIAVS